MKIAECVDLYYPYLQGGSERRSFEITKRLARTETVHVITGSLENSPPSEFLSDNVKVSRIGFFANPVDRRSMLSLLTYILALRKVRIDADVVNYNGFSILGLCKDARSVCTIHDLFQNSQDRSVNSIVAGFAEKIFAGKIGNKLVVVPSPVVGQKVKKFLGIDERQIRVVPNGVDIAYLSKLEEQKEQGKIVFAGRLVTYKNVHHLLAAFSELQKELKVRLVIMGDGPDRAKLERLAPANVTFTGHVPAQVLYREISSAQVFVNPSLFEGFSIVMLESMALGTPVIGYKLPAYYYANSSNSLLVEPGNVSELREAIRGLLLSKDKCAELAESGKRTAKDYDWGSIVERAKDVYKEVAGN